MGGHDEATIAPSSTGNGRPPAAGWGRISNLFEGGELWSMYLTGTFVGVANAAVFHPMDVLRIRYTQPAPGPPAHFAISEMRE
jgi:hypothetical protein